MRKAILLAVLTLSAACGRRSQPADVENTLKQLETDWQKAEARFDADTVDRIMADEWVGTEPDGTRHRKNEELSDLREHKGSMTSFTLDPIVVTVFGDTAIVRAGGTQQGFAPDGEDASGIYVWTNVYIRRNGSWKVVASHTSKVE
jgi:ketosteroid isomerase-like protein